ncbi:X-ray repair cross-complementing protein 5-like [Centruroides sculpturatus]|uniref:X-ray repair cross-complementing protein 5-like n=1 Tax=Centruroides sculpturatus TaxID=218467 RepID=UPI000C6C983B|nr:X-ray repair cross-complementing protein 5-like [Centruroides sculpturatus]
MAANKEAIVIVLDIGPSMCKGSDSPFQNAKACIGMILQRKIFSESKDNIALVLCGTSETDNQLARANKNEYLNISVQYNLQTASWDLLQYIQNIEGTSITADYIDALVVAMDILAEQTKNQKFASQRILIFSNFGEDASNDQIDVIIKGIRNSNMQLNIM